MLVQQAWPFEACAPGVGAWVSRRVPVEGGQELRVLVQDRNSQQTMENERFVLRQLEDIVAPEFLQPVQ